MRTIPWILAAIICAILIITKESPGSTDFLHFRSIDSVKASAFNPKPLNYPPESWPYFLQHLPAEHKPIVDYKGNLIENQEKHFAVLNFDIGNADLQQCADALMRIRAEYLFSKKKYSEIGFHFNYGIFYSWTDYLKGIRPILKDRKMILGQSAAASEVSHSSLRKYLDMVYAYANTVSLCRELKYTNRLETGTVIIYPGNPGHCCMIIDEALVDNRDTVYKLAEGYMPAQSIYILSNPYEPDLNPWYHLGKGDINTASCSFRSYYLRKFE
jgi:hypothetical protein